MKEINIQKRKDNIIYSVIDVKINEETFCKPYNCVYVNNEYYKYNDCSNIKENVVSSFPNSCSFISTTVLFNIMNAGNKPSEQIDERNIKLIDTEGYAYTGCFMCGNLRPFRCVGFGTKVLPHSQHNFQLYFPELPNGVGVGKICVLVHGEWIDFEIDGFSNEVAKLFATKNEEPSELQTSIDTLDSIPRSLNETLLLESKLRHIEADIFERFNNLLSTNEMIKLDNKIQKQLFALSLTIRDIKNQYAKSLSGETPVEIFDNKLKKVTDDYYNLLKSHSDSSESRKSVVQIIDDLYELTPREFEEYIYSLLQYYGYEDVELTPYSNDKGVDVIAYKGNQKVVVQCKRYKKSHVGSPEIQTFIGAMANAKADYGLFITTSMFSFEAEQMAKNNPIKLVNRIELAKMISEALNNEQQK